MKLICMAPKPNITNAPVNAGPVLGVNTSDRNSTTYSDVLPTDESRATSGAGNGNGDASGSMMGSQLNTEIGSLKLTAPGTSRYDTSESSSEDG